MLIQVEIKLFFISLLFVYRFFTFYSSFTNDTIIKNNIEKVSYPLVEFQSNLFLILSIQMDG